MRSSSGDIEARRGSSTRRAIATRGEQGQTATGRKRAGRGPLRARRMSMKRRFAIERERRTGAIDGLNLFFGALLGANLGTLGGLKLVNYMQMIAILAAMVIALRVLSASAKRGRI